jgi:hypothetical protein
LDRRGGRGSSRQDQVDIETNQFRREVRESLDPTIGRPIFDDEVSPFEVTEIPQPFAQPVEIGGSAPFGLSLRSPPLLRSMLARLLPKSTGPGASNTKAAVATAVQAALLPHSNSA